MYTAVIADDEVWIRKWLEQVLSNYDKEIRVAASLDDGLKVKEFLEKEEADILISDIRKMCIRDRYCWYGLQACHFFGYF